MYFTLQYIRLRACLKNALRKAFFKRAQKRVIFQKF